MQEFIDSTNWYGQVYKTRTSVMLETNWPCRNSMILPTGMQGITNWVYKTRISHAGTTGHDSPRKIDDSPTGKYRSQKTRTYHVWKQTAMQEFMILPTGMYRSIKQELHAGNKLAMQELPMQGKIAGIYDSTNWSIKQELQSCWQTNLAMQEFMILPTELSHAGNKLAMQEFMILPTGMYRSIKQELSHAGNKLAMQEFMILPTGMYRSIKQELWSHAGNKLAMQEL
ncbi:ENO [Mytilus coruscus]|uniref:ENO n=1 Tax=Mytilus coruscus TaxID=42192 RepID=A0A6J8BDY8_MYTCO|nr:ENO [Mytilus coruscus]